MQGSSKGFSAHSDAELFNVWQVNHGDGAAVADVSVPVLLANNPDWDIIPVELK